MPLRLGHGRRRRVPRRGFPWHVTMLTWGTGDGRAYMNEILPDILRPGDCPPATALQSGVPLVVTAGGTLRADLNLDRGGIIAGTVTDARTSAPIAGLSVIVHLLIEGGPVPAASASTDASGRYVIQGLPAGRYYAHTYDPSTAYVNEIFDNIVCGWWSCSWDDLVTGTAIAVSPGTTTDGRDFALDRGGRITGTVTDAVTALPLSNVCVTAFVSLSGSAPDVAQDCSDASGAYDLGGLPSGSYRLMAVPPFGSSHVQELYDGISLPGRWLRHRQRQSSCGRARGNDRRKGLLIGDRRRNSRYRP